MFGKEKKEKKEKRFVTKDEQGLGFGALCIVVDTQTGVNYLMTIGSGPNGITPLLDSEGNIVIDQ